jgi:3-deoxy-D-manno-octulosonic-acid transferase
VTLSLALYRAATALLEPLAPALLSRRAARGKEDPARIGERLGRAGQPRPKGALVWLHGASVGETLSLLPLIAWLQAERPDLTLLVTSGTATSAQLLARRLPANVIHQYAPIDAPLALARFLRHWAPGLIVLAEGDIWPNLIGAAKAASAGLALISARMTASSAAGWAKVPASARAVFGAFDTVLAQDDASAERLTALGARDDGRLNLKVAGDPLPVDAVALARLREAIGERPVLLAASTHASDEVEVFEAFSDIDDRPDRPLLLVIAPRHPADGPKIAADARSRGFRTALQSAGDPIGNAQVYVADTLGELGLWYSLARIAYIGGGRSQKIGGHNPLEAIRLGCAVASGPQVRNWAGIYDVLQARDAVTIVQGSDSLWPVFKTALEDPDRVAGQVARGREAAHDMASQIGPAFMQLKALLP